MKIDVWRDKLPEDKAKYYNRTRMSIELFARMLGIAQQVILEELWNAGYRYDAKRRIFEKLAESSNPFSRRTRFRGF